MAANVSVARFVRPEQSHAGQIGEIERAAKTHAQNREYPAHSSRKDQKRLCRTHETLSLEISRPELLLYGRVCALRSGLLRPHVAVPKVFLFIFCLLGIGRLLSAQAGRGTPPSHKLVVISISGFDERFLTETRLRVKVPNIRKMIRQGASASGVIGVAPSETWPSEIALLTGVPPMPQQPTNSLAVAATKAGLKTASIYWPGTAGAEITFDFPALREPKKGQNNPFEDVSQKASPAGLADRVEHAGLGFEKELWDDDSSARAAIYLLKNEKPDVLLVNFSDVDSEQLDTGALSVYSRDSLETDDELIGQIIAASQPGTIFAVISGNGFENENYIVRPRVLLKHGSQPEMRVEVEDGLIGTADRNVAENLRKLLMDGHRHGLSREVPMAEVKAKAPALSRWVAAFDTIPNAVATNDESGAPLGPGSHMGVTGLWPVRPGYRSVFVVSGEGVPVHHLGEIDLLQIAPTLADVLGVRLPQAKAKSLWPPIAH
jgi:hypothetical protein